MKKQYLVLLALAIAFLAPGAAFGFDLNIQPYSQLGAGDVTSTNATVFPIITTKNSGILITAPIDLKEAGKLTLGLDSSIYIKGSSTVAYDYYEDLNLAWTIGGLGLKLGLPFDLASSTANAALLPSLYLTPSYKTSIDKLTSVSLSLYKTTFYLPTSASSVFNIDLQPRVGFGYDILSAYVNLKVPNLCLASAGQNMTLTPDVAVKLGDLSIEALCDFGKINPSKASDTVTVTPWIKASYNIKLSF